MRDTQIKRKSPRPDIIKVKKEVLKRLDYETEVDLKVRLIVRSINSLPESFTTGSCEGHLEGGYDFLRLPHVVVISSVEDLSVLADCASKSGLELELKDEPPIAVVAFKPLKIHKIPPDMRRWVLHPKDTDDWEEAHRKFAHFQELVISYRLQLDE